MKNVFELNKILVTVSVVAPELEGKIYSLALHKTDGNWKEFFIGIRDNKEETTTNRTAAAGVHTLIKWSEACCAEMTDIYLEKPWYLTITFSFNHPANAFDFLSNAEKYVLESIQE